jgi:hypothetical protein
MIDRVLIDTLKLRSRDFAVRWKGHVRRSPQLKHHNNLDDDALIESYMPFYAMLARTLDRGFDARLLSEFFSAEGKRKMKGGFPVSEAIFGINLFQKTIIEYLMTEFAPENPMRMYQAMGALNRVAEFCMLGIFYMCKGFLEETYKGMNVHDSVSEELLKKYFKDDFVFKGSL